MTELNNRVCMFHSPASIEAARGGLESATGEETDHYASDGTGFNLLESMVFLEVNLEEGQRCPRIPCTEPSYNIVGSAF
jgi:hypothetical protein